jgi:hypothetical protein
MIRSPLLQWAARIGLTAWLALMLVAGSYLLAAHLLTLPEPDRADPVFAAAVAATPPADTGWRTLHFLFASCPCSRGVFDHLVSSDRPSGVTERLVLIDDDGSWAAEAAHAGYEVEALTAEQLYETYNVESAPLFVVVDPEGSPRFVGGYTDRKRGPVYHDLDVIDALLAGATTPDLPLFGCAVSRQLQRSVDPMALR